LRSLVGKIYNEPVHVTPPPPLRRIVALDDLMTCLVKVRGRMSIGRVVAASDVAAQPAEAKVNPFSTHF
jgi:hypothetical protein